MINNYLFVNSSPQFAFFDVYYRVLQSAFKTLATTKGQGVLSSFYGKNMLKDSVTIVKSQYKIEFSSNGINLDEADSEGKLPYVWEDMSVQYFKDGFEQKDPMSSLDKKLLAKATPPPKAKSNEKPKAQSNGKPGAKSNGKSAAKSDGKPAAQSNGKQPKGATGALATTSKYGGLLKVVCTLTLSLLVLLN